MPLCSRHIFFKFVSAAIFRIFSIMLSNGSQISIKLLIFLDKKPSGKKFDEFLWRFFFAKHKTSEEILSIHLM